MIVTGAEFDVHKIRKTELEILCRHLAPKIEAFFEDPHNLADFEAWQKQRREASGAA